MKFRGFGELTGLADAMSFLEMRKIPLQPGMRIILASDAIEALGPENEAKARCASEYAEVLLSLNSDPEVAVRELLSLTRAAEVAKGLRSDDATFGVIDI